MITKRFHIILVIAVVLYLIIIIKMLKERVTILKYTLLWLLTGVVLLVFAIFPKTLKVLAGFFGIYADANFLFISLIVFLMLITFSLTHIVSRLNENNKRLVQELAIMDKRVRQIEKSLEEKDHK